jgi:hypothetical protein
MRRMCVNAQGCGQREEKPAMRACMTIIIAAAACYVPIPAQAGSVDWTAFGAALTLGDNTTLAPAGSLIRLGYFTISDAAIQAGQTNLSTLNASFVQLQAGSVGDIAGVPGGFNGIYGESFTGDFTAAFAAAAGKNIYVWTVNASTLAAATQQGIFKWNATYPTDVPIPGPASVDLADLLHGGGTILVGSPGVGTVPTVLGPLEHINMAVIPVDTTPPTITCPADQTYSTDPGQCSKSNVTYSATATDNSPSLTAACTPASGSVFTKGTNTVTCTARDGSGNTSQCNFTVTVTDNQPPTIVAPAATTVNTDAGRCYASAVNLGLPITADNCAVVSVVNDAPAQFNKGVTFVTWTATDSSSNTATAIQTVTVNDNQNPTISCPANIVTNACGPAVVTYPTPTAGDNCAGVITVCVPASGSSFAAGTNTVTCTGTDSSGNTANCMFTITVADTQAPTITCPANITTKIASRNASACSATVTYPAPAVADNCGISTNYCSPPSGSSFPTGTNLVTCTAQDTSGNTGICSFFITVKGSVKPKITCPSDITTNTCDSIAVVTFAPTASDNCSDVTTSCTPPSGYAFRQGTNIVTCAATDRSGNTSSCSFKVIVTADLPTSPRSLTATANVGQIMLTWEASTGAAPITYNVKRGTRRGAETPYVSGISTTSYIDSAVVKGTKYYYIVTGTNCKGAGSDSNTAWATAL